VIALYHSTPLSLPRIRSVRIDLSLPRSRTQLRALKVDAVVHLATKIKSKSKDPALSAERLNQAMLDQVLAMGVPILYASSTVVHWERETPYVRSRKEDEERIRSSGLPYGILRPSAPYGPKLRMHRPRHKESFHTLVDMIRYSPIVPMISHGNYIRQPIHVRDFARAGLAMLEMGLDGMEFDAGGREPLSMRTIINTIAERLDRSVRVLPVPKKIFVWMAKRNPNFEPSLIEAIDQDENIDVQPLIFETGVVVRSFAEGVSDLLR
jgi:nucleoside-diphosphate-sugar epimerase